MLDQAMAWLRRLHAVLIYEVMGWSRESSNRAAASGQIITALMLYIAVPFAVLVSIMFGPIRVAGILYLLPLVIGFVAASYIEWKLEKDTSSYEAQRAWLTDLSNDKRNQAAMICLAVIYGSIGIMAGTLYLVAE